MCFLCRRSDEESEILLPKNQKICQHCLSYCCSKRCQRMFCLDTLNCSATNCLTNLATWTRSLPTGQYSQSLVYGASMVPKFFLAGFAWQGMAEWATTLFGSGYTALPTFPRAGFALMTGAGGGAGVFAGNMISHIITYLLYLLSRDDSAEAKKYFDYAGALKDSALYGLAAFVADSIWQPLVTALASSSLAAVWGTGAICAAAFMITLILVRRFIFTELWYNDGRKTFSSDLIVSFWNIFFAASFFVFTGTVEMPPVPITSPFNIVDGTAPGTAMWLAGQSTLAGYGISQVVEISMKWILRSTGRMTDDDYIASMV